MTKEQKEYRLEYTLCATEEKEARKQFNELIRCLAGEPDVTEQGHLRVMGTVVTMED